MDNGAMSNGRFIERKLCPCCASCRSQEIYRSPFDENPVKEYLELFYSPQGGIPLEYLRGACYVLVECSDCGLIFQKDILNDELMDKLYGAWIDPDAVYAQDYRQTGHQKYASYAQEISQIIAMLGKPPSSLHLLDFGMGWGQWARMAKAFGCDSYGFELCSRRIDAARADGITVLTWEDIPQQQFDFINTEQVFEHLPEPLETMLYLKKSLRPDGILKISVPSAHNIGQRLKRMDWRAPKGSRYSLNPVAPLEHINFFRNRSLLKMADIGGMKPIHVPLQMKYQCTTNVQWVRSLVRNLLLPDNYLLLTKV